MAELNSNEQHNRGKKPHAKKLSTRIDMTPMVDLAFLLLTFFMLTTTFNIPKSLEVNMPEKGKPKNVPPSTVTILVGEQNKLIYYQGIFEPAIKSNFHNTNYSKDGIRKSLMDLNQSLIDKISDIEHDYENKIINDAIYKKSINDAKHNKDNEGIFVIIKASDEAKYENLVLLLDEMKICDVVNYAIVDITKEEEKVLAAR